MRASYTDDVHNYHLERNCTNIFYILQYFILGASSLANICTTIGTEGATRIDITCGFI